MTTQDGILYAVMAATSRPVKTTQAISWAQRNGYRLASLSLIDNGIPRRDFEMTTDDGVHSRICLQNLQKCSKSYKNE
jgi:hypothetical protein